MKKYLYWGIPVASVLLIGFVLVYGCSSCSSDTDSKAKTKTAEEIKQEQIALANLAVQMSVTASSTPEIMYEALVEYYVNHPDLLIPSGFAEVVKKQIAEKRLEKKTSGGAVQSSVGVTPNSIAADSSSSNPNDPAKKSGSSVVVVVENKIINSSKAQPATAIEVTVLCNNGQKFVELCSTDCDQKTMIAKYCPN